MGVCLLAFAPPGDPIPVAEAAARATALEAVLRRGDAANDEILKALAAAREAYESLVRPAA
ncbi:MAG TPA: hypothetical protein VFS92_11395, partial [Planctomycetota bacterium]|nr:hypothetical protein [Planctomycetota bacterium]